MNVIRIEAYENGAHDNQDGLNFIPEGYAVIPECIIIPPSYPFVDIEVEEIDGISTVVKMTAREVPEIEEVEPAPSAMEQLRADIDYLAIMTGVEL